MSDMNWYEKRHWKNKKVKKGSESTGLFKTRLDLSSIRLILGQVWTCLDLYDAN